MFPELELRKKEWMEEMKANMNDNEKQVTKLECTIKYPKNCLTSNMVAFCERSYS